MYFGEKKYTSKYPILYFSEIARASARGTAVNTFNNFIAAGILLVIVAGALASHSWRAAVMAMAVPNIVTLLAMVVYGPETPYFLISINR